MNCLSEYIAPYSGPENLGPFQVHHHDVFLSSTRLLAAAGRTNTFLITVVSPKSQGADYEHHALGVAVCMAILVGLVTREQLN